MAAAIIRSGYFTVIHSARLSRALLWDLWTFHPATQEMDILLLDSSGRN